MRLTLRTLLAFLDGILEPKDAEDLGKKVEESEYATGLVHRVRDVMRRLRLGAPTLTDRGPGLDPNTVSEYLDNTLAPDRVTDFEKVCLDSDIHLAEVASCHQILTLVLGEPAEVDQASRQRMYEVQDVRSGAKPPLPTVPATPAGSAGAPSLNLDLEIGDGDSAERKPRPKPTVPEYLREPRRRRSWLPVAAAVLLAACVIVMILKAFGQLEPGTPGGDVLVRLGLVAPAPQEVVVRDAAGEERGERRGERGEREKETAPTKGAVGDTGKTPSAKAGVTPTGESPVGPIKKTTPLPVEPAAGANGTKAAPPPKTTSNPAATVAPVLPATVEPMLPSTSGVGLPVTTARKPTGDGAKPPAPMPPPDASEPLGRLLSSGDQVLLSDNPSSGWTRVGPNQMLIPQQLLALPTYRPKVWLTPDVTVEILGGTRVELLGSSPQNLPGIRVMFGRVVLMPLTKGGRRLRVAFGDHSGTLTLVDAQSVVAFDVHHLHAPGTNPESGLPRVTADLFVSGGAVSWEEATEEKPTQTLQLMPLQHLGFDAQVTATPVAIKESPKWIAAGDAIRGPLKGPVSPREQLDRRASPVIAQALPTDRPARVGLLELAASRQQKEVKWLALRCLGYVGQFRDIVSVLNDPAHKTDWPDYVDALRAAVDRDSETAAAVRAALEKQYPQQAVDLYRMLWGYTDKQLEAGDDGKRGDDAALVHALDDELLAVRVLGIWNLKDITGYRLHYQPEQTAARRQQPVRYWHQRLDAKEIRLATAEAKAAAHETVTTPAGGD